MRANSAGSPNRKSISDCERFFSFLVFTSMMVFGAGVTSGVVRNGCNKRLGGRTRLRVRFRDAKFKFKFIEGMSDACRSKFLSDVLQPCSIKSNLVGDGLADGVRGALEVAAVVEPVVPGGVVDCLGAGKHELRRPVGLDAAVSPFVQRSSRIG